MADAGLVFLETEGPTTEAQSKEQELMCKGEMTLILRDCFSWEGEGGGQFNCDLHSHVELLQGRRLFCLT